MSSYSIRCLIARRALLGCLFTAGAAALLAAPVFGADATNADWWSRAQEAIADSEYHVTWQEAEALADLDAAWQAPNRAHGFRTHFTDDGIRVVPRTDEQPTWEWGLELVGYGRGRLLWPVLRATPTPDQSRVDYLRRGLVEWYVNDRRGLEQGFTLSGPPDSIGDEPAAIAARTDDGAAWLALEMHGTLQPVLSPDGQAIDLVGASSPLNVARYGALIVRDALDRELPAWMEVVSVSGGRRLYLVFDDAEAVYPVTVDPLLQAEAWSAEGNQTEAQFGFAVAGAGDVNGDGYDDVVVGAPYFDAGQTDEGRAFVFHGSASGLESYPAWTAESNQDDALFGYAVARAGDVNGDGVDDVIVGAPQYESYLCTFYIPFPINACQSWGDVRNGKAFVYLGSPAGLEPDFAWSELGSSVMYSVAWYGHAVTSGDVNGDGYDDVMVGAPYYHNGGTEEGGVFAYLGSSAGLSTTEHTILDFNDYEGHFGYSLAAGDLDGDGYSDVIVGAPKSGAEPNLIGRVLVYNGSGTGLASSPGFNYISGSNNHRLGHSVASANVDGDAYDDLVVSAPQASSNNGRVLLFLGSVTGVNSPFDLELTGSAGEKFGWSVAGAGDVNNDGRDEVIVGAPLFDADGTDRGRAVLYLGSGTGLLPDAAWAVKGEQAGAQPQLGAVVAGAGDVNGDGFDDVIVGAPFHDGDKTDEGKAYVFHGAEDAHVDDLVLHAMERPGMVCEGGTSDGHLCSADADCPPSGTCSGVPAISGTGVVVYADATTPWSVEDPHGVPSPAATPFNNDASPAAYYGSIPHSIVLSTGLAQDDGHGDTDWGRDNDPDLVRWQFSLDPPDGAQTLRFTTQFITSDIANGKSRDSVSLYIWRKTDESIKTVNLAGVSALSLSTVNAPVSHGVRVDDINDTIRLIFEVKDGVDGDKDSAIVISNLYFSGVALPEGGDVTPDPDADRPEFLSNPSPQDTSDIAGTYSYQKSLYSVPGNGMPFEFAIRYSSASTRESKVLGKKWTHSYESTLQKSKVAEDPDGDDDADDVDLVVVRLGTGQSEYFRCAKATAPYTCSETNNLYEPKYAGVYSTLNQTAAASYTYETKDHVQYVFDVDLDNDDDDPGDPYEIFALSTITDSNDNEIALEYDTDDRLDYVLDTRGTVFTFNHDADDGRLTSVANPQGGGGAVSFVHEPLVVDGELETMLVSFSDLNGFETSFTYDKKGNLLTCTDDDGVTFVSNDYEQYTASAGKEQIGDRVTVRRNANPLDTGLVFTFTGEAVRTTDRDDPLQDDFSRGEQVSRYDVKSREHDRCSFLGKDENGVVCTEPCTEPCTDTSPYWATTTTTYEKVCVGGTNAGDSCDTDTDCPSSTCGSTGNPVKVVAEVDLLRDAITEMTYDTAGNLIGSIDAEEIFVEMQYDSARNLLYRATRPTDETDCGLPLIACQSVDSSLCYVEAYCYDANNNLIKQYDSLGDPTSDYTGYTYDTMGRRTSETDRNHVCVGGTNEGDPCDTDPDCPSGTCVRTPNTTNFHYDSRGYVQIVEEPDLGGSVRPTTDHAYDEFGRRTWTKDAEDNESWFNYDTGGRLLSETNALIETTSYTYDVWDRVLSTTLPSGADYLYDYTPTGKLATSSDPEAEDGDSDSRAVTIYTYDVEDRLVEETDPLTLTTQYTCDAADRLVKVIDPADGEVVATYDKAGNLLSVKDPENSTTSYDYDLLGRVTLETDPLGNKLDSAYDERGLVASVKSADDGDVVRRTVQNGYDDAGRLITVKLWEGDADPDPDVDIQYRYDADGNRISTADDRFTGAGEGSIARAFDALNRLVTRTDPFGHTVAYTYDLVGNLVSLCYDYDPVGSACLPDSTVTYEYDALNRIVRVEDWNLNETTYAYDEVGNVTLATLPDGSTVTYTYDDAYRLVGINDEPPSSCTECPPSNYDATYTLNAAGQRTETIETLPPDPPPGFGDLPTADESFTHEANELTSREALYDADGNLTAVDLEDGDIGTGQNTTLTYDPLNQLVRFQQDRTDPDPDVDIQYRYDADGNRVEAVKDGVTTRRYVYDVSGGRPRLLEERDGAGVLIARYVHGNGLISRNTSAVGLHVYHYDGLGSTVALTGPTGLISDQYRYDPYGKVVGREGLLAGGAFAGRNPFTYNGRDGVFDDGSGLYFMRTRHYAPELMRFIQKDKAFSGSLNDPQSLNRYAYVGGDPVSRVDPDGEFWGAIAIVVNVAAQCITGECDLEHIGEAALEAVVPGTLLELHNQFSQHGFDLDRYDWETVGKQAGMDAAGLLVGKGAGKKLGYKWRRSMDPEITESITSGLVTGVQLGAAAAHRNLTRSNSDDDVTKASAVNATSLDFTTPTQPPRRTSGSGAPAPCR